MKVLVVHNQYGSSMPSGENRVVENECAALLEAGIRVETFLRSSDELQTMSATNRARAALSPITGRSSRADFLKAVRRFNPDVVHLHNPYPLISPHVIEVANELGIPTVATIHNFRLQCLNGLLFRDGHICTECEGKAMPLAGVRHSCYRGSFAQSSLMAAAVTLHKRRWDLVARFVAVSGFVADRLRSWGIPSHRIETKPNSSPDPGPATPPGRGYCFAGRLVEEKGILLLLDAWTSSGLDGHVELRVAGDGPLRDLVRQRVQQLRSVKLLGVLTAAEIAAERRRTAVAVMPSLSFETLSAAPESFSHGRAVLATKMGALGEVVDDEVGWSVDPTVGALSAALLASGDREVAAGRGAAARERYERVYRPDVVAASLVAIYETVTARS